MERDAGSLAASAAAVPPRSTMARISDGLGSEGPHDLGRFERRRAPGGGVLGETTRSPGSRAPAMRPWTPWSLASLRMLKLRSIRPRVAAMAATPKASGSAPMVKPPIAVASSGRSSRAASATSRMPSGRHAVCLVSRNQSSGGRTST